MRYIYLDETTFSVPDARIGYGTLITDTEISQEIINDALTQLEKDPDRHIPPQLKIDDATLERGFFHASEDSKNAHSHLCVAINNNVNGYFSSNYFDNEVFILNGKPTNYVYEISSSLSIISGLSTTSAVKVIFEERSGLNLPNIKKWFQKLETELLMSIYEQPYIPCFFPKVYFEIQSKSNPGLQCVDFLLWTVNRHNNGDKKWLSRINTSFMLEQGRDKKEWGALNFNVNERPKEEDVFYQIQDFPQNPDEKINDNKLYNFLLHAVKIIEYIDRFGLPNELSHLEKEIKEVAKNKKNLNAADYVRNLSSIYLKVFDSCHLITEEASEKDKEFLLLSKKYLALTLRKDLLNGVRTCDHLSRARRSLINDSPDVFEFNFG